MRSIFLLFVVLGISKNCLSQTIESKFTQRIFTCKEVAYNCAILIPQYYHKGDLDSVKMFTNYWIEKCHWAEPVDRLKILLAIEADTFNINSHYNILPNLINYRNNNERNKIKRIVSDERNYDHDADYPVEFDSLTVNIARKLLKNKDLTAQEKFFADFYSNNYNGSLTKLASDTFKNTDVQFYYFRNLKYAKKPEAKFSYYLGTWIPSGNLSSLGNHAVLGLEMGIRHKRFTFDGELNYKFLQAQKTFHVRHLDSLWSSKSFNAYYLGSKLGFDLYRNLKHNVNVFGGAAIEANRILNVEKPDGEIITKWLFTPVFSYGIRYGFLFNKFYNVGLSLQNAHYYYKNTGGTDLSGNAYIFTVHIGGDNRDERNKKLKELDALN